MSGGDCEAVRAVLPELALGIADGEQRATALAHLSECADCRLLLEELAAVADELPGLAAPEEPPLGFEQRVLAQIAPAGERTPLRRRVGVALLAATAAAAGAVAMWVGLEGDRELADEYRGTLAEADGEELAAVPLLARDGREVGDVFTYTGETSWLLAVVETGDAYPGAARTLAPGAYRATLLTAAGHRTPLGRLSVGADGGILARELPDADAAQLRLVRLRAGTVAQAELPSEE